MENKEVHEAKAIGAPNKGALQTYLQTFTKEAIDNIVDMMRNARSPQLRYLTAKAIIDKSIADVKAIEVGGTDGQPIRVTVVGGGFVPPNEQTEPISEGSITPASAV